MKRGGEEGEVRQLECVLVLSLWYDKGKGPKPAPQPPREGVRRERCERKSAPSFQVCDMIRGKDQDLRLGNPESVFLTDIPKVENNSENRSPAVGKRATTTTYDKDSAALYPTPAEDIDGTIHLVSHPPPKPRAPSSIYPHNEFPFRSPPTRIP